MEIGTVVICRFENSWSMHVGMVVGIADDGVITLSVNSRGIEVTPESIISIVGRTPESILAAADHGRWMV